MSTEFANDPFVDLPDEPELIFLKLEEQFRAACERAIAQGEDRWGAEQYNPRSECLTYMRQVTAAAVELELAGLEELEIPAAANFSMNIYDDFKGQIDYYRTAFRIRYGRRAKGYSVRFDQKTKIKISHHLQQIREIITKLEVDDWKREALMRCLDNLQLEIDRDRSRFEVFGAIVIETSGILGAAAERLDPIRKTLDSIAGLIWGAHHAEQTPRLEAPKKPKQIPPPKTKRARVRDDMDDEIPF
jgi:hypothetical protein